ncbi:MAG: ABC transporter ATP-binding protein, partial [Rubrivivax sp.]|nr:ABC transporter ATP-binding protein [Rubrivivax sp.]
DGRAVASAGSWLDGVDLQRAADGSVAAELRFPALPLLKGRYTVSAYVLCERAIHIQAAAEHVLAFEVVQSDALQGIVALPRRWLTGAEAQV